ncbi:unnamed protein product [Pocillopora meandrina]|uniref:Uncharacterized protein n=1 Tax=Pocillopora meandrina TaxID=46732 RepID=A0AAU9W3Q6_9CNID|nr:unnamed protein product [Pocillopora meandrina]
MVKWICEEEKTFQRKTRTLKLRPTNDLLAKNGMIGPDEKGRFESYLQWWEDGKKRLYVYGDVGNAAHIIIRRFLTLTAKRSQMIYPSIANTVMILEHQLTACLALYSRLSTENRYPVCLPASYLTMVRFWDNCRPGADKGTFTLYQAVEESYAQEANKIKLFKVVRSLLDYMVRLTCGEVAYSFDVLGDALDSEESPSYCDSGEGREKFGALLDHDVQLWQRNFDLSGRIHAQKNLAYQGKPSVNKPHQQRVRQNPRGARAT